MLNECANNTYIWDTRQLIALHLQRNTIQAHTPQQPETYNSRMRTLTRFQSYSFLCTFIHVPHYNVLTLYDHICPTLESNTFSLGTYDIYNFDRRLPGLHYYEFIFIQMWESRDESFNTMYALTLFDNEWLCDLLKLSAFSFL